MVNMLDRQHVHDFLDRGVDDEGTAKQHDQRMTVERSDKQSTQIDMEQFLLEILDRVHHHEQKYDTKQDGNRNAPFAHRGLLFGWRPFRFDGDVEKVVEPQNRLQRDQHKEREQIVE